jgi:hypothetical protein
MGGSAKSQAYRTENDKHLTQSDHLTLINGIFNKLIYSHRRIFANEISQLLQIFKMELEKEVALNQITFEQYFRIVRALEALNDADENTYLEKQRLFEIELETARLAQTTSRILDSLSASLFCGFYLGGMVAGTAIIFGVGLSILAVIPVIMICGGAFAYAFNPGHFRVENLQKRGGELNTFFAANLHTRSNVPSIYPWALLNSLQSEMNELSVKI